MKRERGKMKPWKFPQMVFFLFLFCFGILFLQLCYLALSSNIYGINMEEFSANRNTIKTTLAASRGTIYDIENNVLAQNMATYTVIAYLSETRTGSSSVAMHVVDKEGTAKALSPILNMSEEYILSLLNRKAYQVELGPGGRGISELVKDEIEALELPGIDFMESYTRKYPNGDFASYIIGYAKTNDDGMIAGELGIEAKYDDDLKGTDGYLEYQRDRFGYKIPDTKETRVEANDGNDIYLTIDSNIQRFLETAVKDTANTYHPEWFQMAVMDAKTGDILAASASPSFDPNIRNITNYENPLVSFSYEPGSVMKTYTYMCAMEKGTYDGNKTFQSGSIAIGDNIVNDWNGRGFGVITFDKGYEFSSNVGVATMMQTMLNRTDLKECFEKFGFGSKTDVGLPREFSGSVSFYYPIEVAAASYGQGITTTAIQQLQGLSILANQGSMVKPHIVKKIINPNTGETLYQSEVEKSERLVSEKTVNQMKDLMYNTVNADDAWTTGKYYKIDGYDIIAKTGTAQIYNENTGTYMIGDNDYIYSFAGMFPKDDPEIILYAAIKRPSYGESGTLPNAVKTVIQSIATYRNMFSEKVESTAIPIYALDTFLSKNTNSVKQALEQYGLKVTILGDGDQIIDQYPKAGTPVLSKDRIILLTNGKNITLPDLTMWSRSEAVQLLKMLHMKVTVDTFGYVKEQSVAPGTLVTRDMEIILTLEDKYGINKQADPS